MTGKSLGVGSVTASSDDLAGELLKGVLDVNRLAAAYLAAKTRLDQSTVDPGTKKSAETLLNYTRTALEKNKIYVGWAAQRSRPTGS